MSQWMTAAESVKTRLESLAILAGIDVLIDRQKDIESTVAESVSKASGVCVTIFFSGSGIEGDTQLVTRPIFEIRLYTQPVLQDEDATPADDLLEAILPALHGWHPNSWATHDEKFRIVSDPDVIPDRNYLVYGFHIQGRSTLPAPEFIPEVIP